VNALPPQREVHYDVETPPPVSSGSPLPPGSPSVASSRRPCSLVFEQGNAFRNILMLEPSSFIADTSRDEKITRNLFGYLNRDILGPPGDSKIIILDDSDDDGEAQEETTVEIESTVARASADGAPAEVRIDNSDDQEPNQEADGGDNSGHSTSDP
jgi:hypothetical protein